MFFNNCNSVSKSFLNPTSKSGCHNLRTVIIKDNAVNDFFLPKSMNLCNLKSLWSCKFYAQKIAVKIYIDHLFTYKKRRSCLRKIHISKKKFNWYVATTLYLILSTALIPGYSSSTEQKNTKEKDCLMTNINKPEGEYFCWNFKVLLDSSILIPWIGGLKKRDPFWVLDKSFIIPL